MSDEENGKRRYSKFRPECSQEERGRKPYREELGTGSRSCSGGSGSGARSRSRLSKGVEEQAGQERLPLVEVSQVRTEECRGAGVGTQQPLESAPVASTSRVTPSVGCSLCGASVPRRLLGQHIRLEHFPWYFAPELSCWTCQVAVATSTDLRRHQECQVMFSAENLGRWLEAMKMLLVELKRAVSKKEDQEFLRWISDNALFSQESGFVLSPSRGILLSWLDQYMGGGGVDVSVRPPNCVAAVASWNCLYRVLERLPVDRRAPVLAIQLPESKVEVRGVSVVDGHAHLDILKRNLGVATVEEAMQRCWLEHSTPIVEMVTHVVSNCVFPYSWDHPPVMDNNQDITVFHTFGVHPRLADGFVPWEKVHARVKSSACYGIGECGLDRTISHMPEQKTNFKKQLKWAMELKKPLVLHLRGKDHKDTLAVYKEALEVAGKVLGRRHAVYLHCFTADYPTFLMWRKRFGNLLVGVTWKTTSTPDFPRLGRGLPLECLVFESDCPYLPPPGYAVNSPYLLSCQAAEVSKFRNMPEQILLEASNNNLARFFGWLRV